MPLVPALIEPRNEDEQRLTDNIAHLVARHFRELCQSTSPAMREQLQRLIVRTVWDSAARNKYGEYYGVPAPQQTTYDTGMLPPEVVIFAYPLIRDFPESEILNAKVRIVLVHEIGHHLGLSEAELRKRKIF